MFKYNVPTFPFFSVVRDLVYISFFRVCANLVLIYQTSPVSKKSVRLARLSLLLFMSLTPNEPVLHTMNI